MASMKEHDVCEGKPGILTCSTAEMLDTLGMCLFFVATGTAAAVLTGTVPLVAVGWTVTAISAAAGVVSYLGAAYIKRKIETQEATVAAQEKTTPARSQGLAPAIEPVYAPVTPRMQPQPNKQPTMSA